MWEKPIALTFNVGKARQEEKQVGRELDLGDRRTVSHLTPVADLIRKGSLNRTQAEIYLYAMHVSMRKVLVRYSAHASAKKPEGICDHKGKDPCTHPVDWTFLECFVGFHDDTVVVQAQWKSAFLPLYCARMQETRSHLQ